MAQREGRPFAAQRSRPAHVANVVSSGQPPKRCESLRAMIYIGDGRRAKMLILALLLFCIALAPIMQIGGAMASSNLHLF